MSSRSRTFLLYALTAVVSFLAFVLADRLWHADLSVPFSYVWYGDAIEPQMKFLLDGGWFFEPHLAAPFGLHTQEFTQLNTVKWFIRWILVEATQSPFLAQNLFVLLDPIIASITFLYAARRLKLAYAAALPCAILYGNLYMLYWRILASHGLQSAYWITPLACLALLQMARGMPIMRSRETFVFIATAVVLGLESHYEVVFAGSLAIIAVIVACVQQRSLQTLKTFGVFVAAMAVGFIVNIAPMIDWLLTHHGHIYKYSRAPIEAFLYSLSIGQMILPNLDHRIAAFAQMRRDFDAVFPPLDTENRSATLGFIGDFGLLVLIAAVIARGSWKVPRELEHSGFLSIAALGIATTGGIAAIFNIFVNSDVHAFTRISTWIAFFCLIAVAYLLERLWQYSQKRSAVAVYFAFGAVLTIAGVLDQSPVHTPPYAESHTQALADKAWTQKIESVEPAGAAILELPYVDDVDSLQARLEQVPFMYSAGLRWSVGAYRETPEAVFESWLASLSAKPMVAAALLSGYDGILIYRSAYNDHAAALESGLQAITGRPPLVGVYQSQSFFPINGLVAVARSADPSVGTRQGITEAVEMSRNADPQQTEQLVRIENAVSRPH